MLDLLSLESYKAAGAKWTLLIGWRILLGQLLSCSCAAIVIRVNEIFLIHVADDWDGVVQIVWLPDPKMLQARMPLAGLIEINATEARKWSSMALGNVHAHPCRVSTVWIENIVNIVKKLVLVDIALLAEALAIDCAVSHELSISERCLALYDTLLNFLKVLYEHV